MATFKTRARAVDLLGKQQIRDEVTAISELLRNSYDADASEGIVDVSTKQDRIFVWDDGDGMDEHDIQTKWLTLGTYDKYKSEFKPTTKERTRIGEKGIGRLAISLLGDQLLLISKKRDNSHWSLLYLHWGLFRNEKAFLEDIIIPTKSFDTFDKLTFFLKNQFENFKNDLLSNLINQIWSSQSIEKIRQDVFEFKITEEIIDWIAAVEDRGSGSLFYISPMDNAWDWSIYQVKEAEGGLKQRIQRMKDVIFSFQNIIDLFNRDDFQQKDENAFIPRIHIDEYRLEDQTWFNEEELKFFDYALEGLIENGQFNGRSLIRFNYNDVEKTPVINIPLTRGIYAPSMRDCGPINIRWYFLEGTAQLSSLSKDQFNRMMDKLETMGGIYVFRDGLRILPYGEPGNDFLNLEMRRSKSAAYYLFSFRRMFGYMEISKKTNPGLIDKSSREGFVENKEFNYFRMVGENLLIWWARDFLESTKETGLRGLRNKKLSDLYETQKIEQDKKRQEENQDKKYFRDLNKQVSQFDIELEKQCRAIKTEIDGESLKYKETFQPNINSKLLLEIELVGLKESLYSIVNQLDKVKINLNRRYFHQNELIDIIEICNYKIEEREKDLKSYVDTSIDLLQNELEKIVNKLNQDEIYNSINERIHLALEWYDTHKSEFSKIGKKDSDDIINNFSSLFEDLKSILDKEINTKQSGFAFLINDLNEQSKTLKNIWGNLDLKYLAEHENLNKANEILQNFESNIKVYQEKISLYNAEITKSETFESLKDLILDFKTKLNSPSMDTDDSLIGMLKKEVILYRELSALGLAAELTSHEFNASYGNIKENMSYLYTALRNTNALSFLEQIRKSFVSLERLHQRMSPLYRQSRYRSKQLNLQSFIREILEYFSSDFEKYEIKTIVEIPSSLYVQEVESVIFTPLINIVSNAIYWLLDQKEREIYFYLSQDYQMLYIHDTGPGVAEKDRNRIFEPFFSRKLNGRGLGLFLSRDILESKGYYLNLVPSGQEPRPKKGACFSINFNGKGYREVAEDVQ